VQAAVEGNLRAIEADDLVVREKDLVRDLLEDPGRLPLFATAPNGRVGDLGAAKTLGVLPSSIRVPDLTRDSGVLEIHATSSRSRSETICTP